MLHLKKYEVFKTFTLRVPLLSIDYLTELTSNYEVSDMELKGRFKNPIINEAIFLASPDLHKQINFWVEGQVKDNKKGRRLKLAFLKYLSRMSTRCTPFGLFAGCTTGTFSESTQLLLEPSEKFKRYTRFDMHFLISIAQHLGKNTEIRDALKWQPNSSLYKLGEQWRYVEYFYEDGKRNHNLQAVTSFPLLDSVLNFSTNGRHIKELVSFLKNNGVDEEEAKVFINNLIDNQIVVSNIEPSLTGSSLLEQLVKTLSSIQGFEDFSNTLNLAASQISHIDLKLGNSTGFYDKLFKSVEALKVNFSRQHLLQADLFAETKKCELEKSWIPKLKKVLAVLNKIYTIKEETNLSKFKDAFIRRYDKQEVPLVQALDFDLGIGYPVESSNNTHTPFLDDLVLPIVDENSVDLEINKLFILLNKKVQYASKNGENQIAILDEDLVDFELVSNELPSTMFAKTELVSIKNHDYMVVNSINGNSAANLLTRFCYADKEINEIVKFIVSKEEELLQDKSLSEIIHISSERIGNVTQRPLLRKYEIPYLARSGMDVKSQISVSDLFISIVGGNFKLTSKKTGKEVVPYLTNAHNYSSSTLPIYRFLCELSDGSKNSGVSFSWGALPSIFTKLPRVVYKNIILSKASWTIEANLVLELYNVINDSSKLLESVKKLREQFSISQWVSLVEGDNKLLINLENATSIRMLLTTVKNLKWFMLEEFLFSNKTKVKNDSGMGFANELIFSFYQD